MKVARELRDLLQVGTLRVRPEVAKLHVLNHALAAPMQGGVRQARCHDPPSRAVEQRKFCVQRSRLV